MNTCMWSWWFPKWDVSKSWDDFQGWRHMITIGLKMVWEPKNCYQGVSVPWIIWSRKFFLKKVIAVLLRSTIMSKWELVAILHLLQVMERSNSSKTFDKSSIQSPLQKSKSKKHNIFIFVNNFSRNTFWILKPLNQPARQIQTPLHCECNISVTMAGIIKWLGYTIHRIHTYNWFKFEDLTPTGLDSRGRQKVSHLIWQDLYTSTPKWLF